VLTATLAKSTAMAKQRVVEVFTGWSPVRNGSSVERGAFERARVASPPVMETLLLVREDHAKSEWVFCKAFASLRPRKALAEQN
jgi:hypothetical protein